MIQMNVASPTPAEEVARLVFEASSNLHKPTTLVVGPDWQERLRGSLAYRVARLLGRDARFVHGAPKDVLQEIGSIGRGARADMRLLVLPYVLHDFKHEGLEVGEVVSGLRDDFPNATILAADYTYADYTPDQVLSEMHTQVERKRVAQIGAEQFLTEHRVFTHAQFQQAFDCLPYVHSVRFPSRTVLHAARNAEDLSIDIRPHVPTAKSRAVEPDRTPAA